MKGLFSALLLDVLYINNYVTFRFSISFLISTKFTVAWMCWRTILKLLLRFICMEFYIPSFELFYYVDVSDRAFGLNFNLFIICHFYFIFANGDFFSRYERNEKLSILTTKMNGDLIVFFLS